MENHNHTCLNCGKIFNYCRACAFKPIHCHEFECCSEECLSEYRMKQKELVIDSKSDNKEEPIVEITEEANGADQEPSVEKIEGNSNVAKKKKSKKQ